MFMKERKNITGLGNLMTFTSFVCVLLLSGISNASLMTIGTASLEGSEYKLIYDDDNNGQGLVWLDYSHIGNWAEDVAWIAGLNGGSVITYNLNPGVAVNWAGDWRLSAAVDGPYVFGWDGTTTGGYNVTTSELGHLFYDELGNSGWYDTEGNETWPNTGLKNTGDFDNLFNATYWSGTDISSKPGTVWAVAFSEGNQGYSFKYNYQYGLAVRPGEVIPEPTMLALLGIGGLAMLKRKHKSRARSQGPSMQT